METDRLEDAILDMDEWYAVYRNDTVSFESMEEQDETSLAIIKSALKKQVPMKPIINKMRRRVCPNCMDWLPYSPEVKYCPDCGQAIDWNEGEE